MRSILEELFYGNICPNNDCRSHDKEAQLYKMAGNSVTTNVVTAIGLKLMQEVQKLEQEDKKVVSETLSSKWQLRSPCSPSFSPSI